MFNPTRILHTALVTTVLAAAACSASTTPDTAAPDTLREGEHQKLASLLGEWKGTGSLQMGENTAAVTSNFSCEVAPGGVALACTHQAEIEGMGPMVENALIGIDPTDGKLHWYNVNTMGETHDHVGHWTSDEQIAWSFHGEAEGQPLEESITMSLGGDTLSFRSETTVGGQPAALFEGTMRR
jgi:hypothetical protein